MEKKIVILGTFLCSIFSYSQVGINTKNPQGVFNVDGAKNNAANGKPTLAQQKDDFVVLENGNVGIGTTTPITKLEVNNGTTAGAIKIVDGSQGANKVLVSDADGVGTWQTPSSIRATIIGNFPPTAIISNSISGTDQYSGIYIDLPQGKWIVNTGLTISYLNTTITRKWVHAYLSTNTNNIAQNGFAQLGPAGANTKYSGVLTNGGGTTENQTLNFVSGSTIINVTATSLRIYLIIESLATNDWQYTTGSNENFLYAFPIN